MRIFFILLSCCIFYSSYTFSEQVNEIWRKDKSVHTEIFIREYTVEHISKNPLQRVSKIVARLDFIPKQAKLARKDLGAGFEDDSRDKILISIYVKYLDHTNWYQQEAVCSKIKNNYNCYANITDGGNFILNLNSKNQIFLNFSENNNIPLEECVKGAWENSEGKTNTFVNRDGKGEKFILYRADNFVLDKRLISKYCFDF